MRITTKPRFKLHSALNVPKDSNNSILVITIGVVGVSTSSIGCVGDI